MGVFGVALMLLPPLVRAQDVTVRAGDATGAITIDGVLDEPDWNRAGVIADLVQKDPHPGQPTPFHTRIRVLKTERTLYFGIEADDPAPSEIAAHSLKRDAAALDNGRSDDHVTIVLDTFDQRRHAYVFQFNGSGARSDGLLSTGSDAPSWDWNGLWDVKTQRTAQGWTAEVAIPLATIRFRTDQPRWGMNIDRFVPRELLTLIWSGHTLEGSVYNLWREGTLDGMIDLKQGLGLAITPYALLGYDTQRSGTEKKAGLDATYSITPALTAAMTLYPDFAEAQALSEQINLTPFPLFLPENRAFFLEGSNLFSFGVGLDSPDAPELIPFYSRRIGLSDAGIVPLDVGGKVVGEAGPVSIGILDVQTAHANTLAPQNLFASRVAYNATERLQVGTIVTHGDPTGASDNTFYAGDAIWKTAEFAGDKNLVLAGWAARSSGDPLTGMHAGWGARVDYPNDLWQLGAKYNSFGDALNPALGFLPRPGIQQYEIYAAYSPRPQGSWFDWVRQFFYELYAHANTDQAGHFVDGYVFTAPINFVTQSGDHYEFDWIPYAERLVTPFAITDTVRIPIGEYHWMRYRVESQSARSRPWRVGGLVETGGFYDGSLTQATAFVTWSSLGGHIKCGLNGESDFGHLPEGNFVTRLFGLQADYYFDPNIAVTSLSQYDTISRKRQVNAAFHWTFVPGREFVLVFNHDVQVLTNAATTGNGQATGNQFIAKLSWTFQP